MNDPTVQVTKRCSKCGEQKAGSREFWHRQAAGKYGFTSACRDCKRMAHAATREGMPARVRTPMEQRFWRHVQRGAPGECWAWTAFRDARGYGHIGSGGRGAPGVLAHRLSAFLAGFPIDLRPGRGSAQLICHRCDNPACVNPAHLFIGTPADNSADMVAKCRQQRGERRPLAKLTAGQVAEIRRLRDAGGITQVALARRFGVSTALVSMVVNGHAWAHVPGA